MGRCSHALQSARISIHAPREGGDVAITGAYKVLTAGNNGFSGGLDFHFNFLLVMEGPPWYNGLALVVGGSSGVLLALYTS